MKNKLYKRKFLNPKTGTAMFEVDFNPKELGTVVLSDCNRQITLEFDVYSLSPAARKKKYNERLQKAKLLAETFAEIVEYMETNKDNVMNNGYDYE